MSREPIFARTRYSYDSYSDFWKLVELSGFRTCYVDQMDLDADEVYVTAPVNGETRPHIFHRRSLLKGAQKAQIIVWALERPINPDLPTSIEEQVVHFTNEHYKFCDGVWISDRFLASKDPRLTYVELGSHPDLAGGPPESLHFDFAHLSCGVPRRIGIYDLLRRSGARIAPNAWGAERDRHLRNSRAMVNIHQDNSKVIEPLRIAVAAAYRLSYLTEECYDLYPLVLNETCLQGRYEEIANLIPTWLRRGDLAEIGERLHQRLCVQTDFRKGVMAAFIERFANLNKV